MPTPGRSASTSRLAALAAGAVALLLAGCGGGGPRCDLPPVVTADQSWQAFGPADWPAGCPTLTVDVPALATDERAALLLVNAGGPDGTATVTLAGTLGLADAGEEPPAALALEPLTAEPGPLDRAALDEGHALVTARRRAGSEALHAQDAAASTRALAVTPPLLAAAAPQVGDPWKDPRGPCVYSYTDGSIGRRPATLQHVSAGGDALFYVTDDVWPGFQNVIAARPDFWATLESYLEGTVSARNPAPVTRRILPALHEAFGQESDVDGNGALVFLFADLGKPPGASGIPVGYFYSPDAALRADATAACNDRAVQGSNGADLLYLLDPCTFNRYGQSPVPATCARSGDGGGKYPYSAIIDQELPGTMAHELQHLVLYNARCKPGAPGAALASCPASDSPTGDLWLNEGLSMVSEDFAGFGLNGASERGRVGTYLNCRPTGGVNCHQGASLTQWPGDTPGNPTGHYGGVHAFLRWHADQAAAVPSRAAVADPAALTRALVGSALPSRAAVAAVSGLTFEEGYARFATAALFSGEDPLFAAYPLKPAPAFSFAGTGPWSPLHQALQVSTPTATYLGYARYGALPDPAAPGAPVPAPLLRDGWRSYVTRRGSGGDVRLTVTSAAGVKPRAVVVRFKGTLPLP